MLINKVCDEHVASGVTRMPYTVNADIQLALTYYPCTYFTMGNGETLHPPETLSTVTSAAPQY